MVKKRQFLGIAFDGIIHQKAQHVDMTSTRGIVWNRPECYMVNTPLGQLQIYAGDWLLELPTGVLYVIRSVDIEHFFKQPIKKWWKIW